MHCTLIPISQSVYIVEILLATCLLPLLRCGQSVVFTIENVERCAVDIETTPFNTSQTIEQ